MFGVLVFLVLASFGHRCHVAANIVLQFTYLSVIRIAVHVFELRTFWMPKFICENFVPNETGCNCKTKRGKLFHSYFALIEAVSLTATSAKVILCWDAVSWYTQKNHRTTVCVMWCVECLNYGFWSRVKRAERLCVEIPFWLEQWKRISMSKHCRFARTNAMSRRRRKKRRNHRGLSHMLVQIVLLRDIEWGSSLAELKT